MNERSSPTFFYAPQALLPGPEGHLYRAPALLEIDSASGRFANVVTQIVPSDVPPGAVRLDGVVAPGFVELQTNGAFGWDVARDDDALTEMARRLPSTGVTAFLPTLVTSERSRYGWALSNAERAREAAGARVLGLHLEGPFLSPARAGAHRHEHLQSIDAPWLLGLLDAHPGAVKLVTLAPELPGAPALIEALHGRGVRVSAGHTDASEAALTAARRCGLSLLTHLSNAMPKSLDEGPLRFFEASAHSSGPQVHGGLILDGLHVRAPLLRELYGRGGPRRLFLVTDAAPCAGMPDGPYTLGEMNVIKKGDTVHLADAPVTLAGSALTMDTAVRNGARLLGCSLEEAIQMATQTPAEALGLSDLGVLRPSAWADFIQLSPQSLEVERAYRAGECVFERAGGS